MAQWLEKTFLPPLSVDLDGKRFAFAQGAKNLFVALLNELEFNGCWKMIFIEQIKKSMKNNRLYISRVTGHEISLYAQPHDSASTAKYKVIMPRGLDPVIASQKLLKRLSPPPKPQQIQPKPELTPKPEIQPKPELTPEPEKIHVQVEIEPQPVDSTTERIVEVVMEEPQTNLVLTSSIIPSKKILSALQNEDSWESVLNDQPLLGMVLAETFSFLNEWGQEFVSADCRQITQAIRIKFRNIGSVLHSLHASKYIKCVGKRGAKNIYRLTTRCKRLIFQYLPPEHKLRDIDYRIEKPVVTITVPPTATVTVQPTLALPPAPTEPQPLVPQQPKLFDLDQLKELLSVDYDGQAKVINNAISTIKKDNETIAAKIVSLEDELLRYQSKQENHNIELENLQLTLMEIKKRQEVKNDIIKLAKGA